MAKERLPGGGDYSDEVRRMALQIHNRQIANDRKKLYTMFQDFYDEEPPVPEKLIADTLREYISDPSLAGYGAAYIKAVILGRHKQAAKNGPSQEGTKQRNIV
jgi:hypothetical protein